MKRHAVLIEAPSARHPDSNPSIAADISSLTSYLKSVRGGAWENDEITLPKAPSRKGLSDTRTALEGTGYLFIGFSGHGSYAPSGDGVQLALADDVLVDEEALNGWAERQTVLLDCCANWPAISAGGF